MRPNNRLHRRTLLVLAAALPAGCASPNPNLYTLAVLPGAQRAGGPPVVELRTIAVAHYLERSQIVRSSEGFRLDVLSNDWWGEPLTAMLSRVLVLELTQRLPGCTIYAENSAISMRTDISTAINIERMDIDSTGTVVLIAQIAVSGRNTVTRTERYAVQPSSGDTAGLVSAMSTAVSQLADTVASMLSGRRS